jgi:hypothetical protein
MVNMATPEELEAALFSAQSGQPEACIESAVAVYLAAATEIDRYEALQNEAKRLIGDVMTETGNTRYSTRAGVAAVTSPSTVASYDSKALDVLLRADADLALKLFPYRRETQRAGTLRISPVKG